MCSARRACRSARTPREHAPTPRAFLACVAEAERYFVGFFFREYRDAVVAFHAADAAACIVILEEISWELRIDALLSWRQRMSGAPSESNHSASTGIRLFTELTLNVAIFSVIAAPRKKIFSRLHYTAAGPPCGRNEKFPAAEGAKKPRAYGVRRKAQAAG